jgi:predicted kinase
MDETQEVSNKNKPQTIDGPALLIIRGLPGSGKTYLAAALRDALGGDKVVLLDPDAIDYTSKTYTEHTHALTTQGVEKIFHPYRFLRSKAHKAIVAGKIIIWNQPFTLPDGLERTLKNLCDYAVERDINLPVLLVEIEIDLLVAKARIESRKRHGGHGPSDDRFARFVDEYTTFAGKGYQTITVSGGGEVSVSASLVMKALQNIQQH